MRLPWKWLVAGLVVLLVVGGIVRTLAARKAQQPAANVAAAQPMVELAQADVVQNTQVDPTHAVRIEFDPNIRKQQWKFHALSPVVDVHPGELTQVVFEVANKTEGQVWAKLSDGR